MRNVRSETIRPKRAKQTGRLKHYAQSPTHAHRSTGENATVCHKWTRTRPYVEVTQVNCTRMCVWTILFVLFRFITLLFYVCVQLYRWYSFVFVSNHTWSHVKCVCMLPTSCAPATYQFCSFRAVQKMYLLALKTSIFAIVLTELRCIQRGILIQIWPLCINYVIFHSHIRNSNLNVYLDGCRW